MPATFDHDALVTALERARQDRGLSWRQVAVEADLEPSTLVRIVGGRTPDLPRFAALVDWLGVSADTFIRRGDRLVPDLVFPNGKQIFIKFKPSKPLSDSQVQRFAAAAEAVLKAMDTT